MSKVVIPLPSGDEARIEPKTVFVLRDLQHGEKKPLKLDPSSQTVVFCEAGNFYPSLELSEVVALFKSVKFAELHAPNDMTLFVNADHVVDFDQAKHGAVPMDDPRTRSVLEFATGKRPPTVRVRETRDQLVEIWASLGLVTNIFD